MRNFFSKKNSNIHNSTTINVNGSTTYIETNNGIHNHSGSGPMTQGSGVVVTKPITPKMFDKIESESCVDINVCIGKELSITVTAEDNIIDLLEVSFKGGTLVVGTKPNTSFSTNHAITINAVTPTLDCVSTKGSGDISVENLAATNFRVDTLGSGDVCLAGKSNSATFKLMGSGCIKASSLTTKHLVAQVFGSGFIKGVATESMDAQIFGSGDINITGNPKQVISASVLGSGSLKY